MDADTFSSMLSERYRILRHRLNEKALRLCAAADARTLGHGGIVAVAKACELARNTFYAGIHEIETGNRAQFDTPESSRIRKAGGGRKQLITSNPRLLVALDQMVDPVTSYPPIKRM